LAILKQACVLLCFLIFGCAQLEKGYQDTRKVIFPEDAKPKPAAKAPEAKKPPEAEKPKETAPPAREVAPAPAKTPPAEDFILHKVAGGETLATIARWYSGKTTTWREIAAGNPGLDPSRLKEGQVIKIPLSLATVHKEPPAPASAGSPGPAKKTLKDKEDSEGPGSPESKPVFGPK
jgi:nucleoid-associated protein YgaU